MLPALFFRPAGSSRVGLCGQNHWVLCLCRRVRPGGDSAVETQGYQLACALGLPGAGPGGAGSSAAAASL